MLESLNECCRIHSHSLAHGKAVLRGKSVVLFGDPAQLESMGTPVYDSDLFRNFGIMVLMGSM